MQQDLPAYPSPAALDRVQQHPARNRDIKQQREQVEEDETQRGGAIVTNVSTSGNHREALGGLRRSRRKGSSATTDYRFEGGW